MKYQTLALATLLLASCATNSGVQPLTDDVFYIRKQGATGFTNIDDVRASALADARAYCDGQHKHFSLVNLEETKPPYILGNFPRAEVRFRCVVDN